jgi:hypothetical protein
MNASNPINVFCPICAAKPSKPCTEPLSGEYHVARVFRAKKATGVRGAKTIGN